MHGAEHISDGLKLAGEEREDQCQRQTDGGGNESPDVEGVVLDSAHSSTVTSRYSRLPMPSAAAASTVRTP